MPKHVIELVVKGQQLRFEPDLQTYNKYINELMPNDKVSPAVNYLRRSVLAADKDFLNELLLKPGMAMKLLSKVNEVFEDDVEIELKN